MEELTRKVDRIYDALIGIEGQEEDSLIFKVRSHNQRIAALESWRWYLLGAFAAFGIIAKALKVL